MMDATATPLLHLCRRRAYLLRRAMEALVPCTSNTCGSLRRITMTLDDVDAFLASIEKEIDRFKKEATDGLDSD